MPRIRTVKPALFRHEELFEAEQQTRLPLRLAFIGLFTCCDREGRFRWRPRQLKLDVLPYDDIDMSRVLDVLATRGFIVKYEISGVHYGCIPSWTRHQCINNRESDSEIPAPPANQMTISNNHSENKNLATREVRVEHASGTCTSGRGKGKEGNMERNMEGKGNVASLTRQSQAIKFVFSHWQKTMNHLQAKLDDKRKKLIYQALKWGYSEKQLCEAISGCAKTPHNMGENDSGQHYDGLHVILRNGDQIDRFIRNFHHPPVNKANAQLQQNAKSMQRWLQKKMQEET